ncbi:MAG: hypothetical protein KDD43_00295 [Bdellovibrionales bacterium]|nr:hypothetical protein [Bdellovibrionales bacterium]
MVNLRKPKIDLGGVYLDAQDISWAMLSGTRSAKMQLTLTKERADAIAKLKGPLTLRYDLDVATLVSGESTGRGSVERGSSVATNTAKFKVEQRLAEVRNLYLLETKSADDPWWVNVFIGDQRHLWDGRLFSRDYNIHRKTNDIKVVEFGGGTSERKTAANFKRFNNERYVPWSLKQKDKFLPLSTLNLVATSGEGEPWTAMGVVRNILEQELELKPGKSGPGKYRFEKKEFDNGYPPENLSWEMESVQGALESVLGQAYANIYQHPDGEIVIYDVRDRSGINMILQEFQPMEGTGFPVQQDLSRIRPGKSRSLFRVEREVKWVYKEEADGQTVPDNLTVFSLYNVIPVPDEIRIKVPGGKRDVFQKGELVPIEDYIEIIDLLDGPGKSRGRTLDLSAIRNNWFTNRLELIFTQKLSDFEADPLWVRRIAAIKMHYRQTFMIAPHWMKRIRSWKPERAAVINPQTGTRQPAPVYTNYCEIPSFRMISHKKHIPRTKQKAAYNVTGYSDNIDDAVPSHFTIQILDQELGLFRIDFAQDDQNLVKSIVPSEVDNIPNLTVGSSPADLLWNGAKLKDTHNFATILSVVFAEPNDEERHYVVKKDIPTGNPKKTHDIKVFRDSARFKWTDKTKATFTQGKIKFTGDELANGDVIKAIADAEVSRLQAAWEDLTVGVFSQPNWKTKWTPSGSMKSVTIRFSARRGLETVFNMSEKPPSFDIFGRLPQSVRTYLYKQLIHG